MKKSTKENLTHLRLEFVEEEESALAWRGCSSREENLKGAVRNQMKFQQCPLI